MLANFYDTLQAGNLVTLPEALTMWLVYRQKTDETQIHYAGVVDSGTYKMRDYMVANNNSYIYAVFPKSENYMGGALYSEAITTDFWEYSITDLVTKEVWRFKLNPQSESIANNESLTIITNNTQYPVVYRGASKYKSGQVAALLGKITSATQDYGDDNPTKINELRDCLTNGNKKLLKTKKGEILQVETYGFNYSPANESVQMQTTITFSWVEVGDVSSIVLYDEIIA